MDLTVNSNRQTFGALRIKLFDYGSRNKQLNKIISNYKHIQCTNLNKENSASLFFWTQDAEDAVVMLLRKMNISYECCNEVDRTSVPVKYFWAVMGRMPSEKEVKNIPNILESEGIVIPQDIRLPVKLDKIHPDFWFA